MFGWDRQSRPTGETSPPVVCGVCACYVPNASHMCAHCMLSAIANLCCVLAILKPRLNIIKPSLIILNLCWAIQNLLCEFLNNLNYPKPDLIILNLCRAIQNRDPKPAPCDHEQMLNNPKHILIILNIISTILNYAVQSYTLLAQSYTNVAQSGTKYG